MKSLRFPSRALRSFHAVLLGVAPAAQSLAAASADSLSVRPDHPALLYSGRTEMNKTTQATLAWSGARVRMRFQGKSVAMRMTDDTRENCVVVRIDGVRQAKLRLDAADGLYTLASDLAPGEHTVEVVRATEAMLGQPRFHGFILEPDGAVLPWVREPDRRILFGGEPITCG